MDKNVEEIAIGFAKYLMSKEITSMREGNVGKESKGIKRVSSDYQLMFGELTKNGTQLFKDYMSYEQI
jgi:hypothetical protein